MEPIPFSQRWGPRLIVVAGVLVLLSIASVSIYAWKTRQQVTITGLRVGGVDVGGKSFSTTAPDSDELAAGLTTAANRYLDLKLTLVGPLREVKMSRRELGFSVDHAVLRAAVTEAGRQGDPWADVPAWVRARRGKVDLAISATVDTKKLVEVMCELKDELDHAAVDAHLDLERHTVAPEQPGTILHVYESAASVEDAALTGADRVVLSVTNTAPKVLGATLANIDISTVVGRWETRYSSTGTDSDRTYNLKVGADHLNGHILQPGEVFSFNEVVGNRTEKEGYRVAPVIQAGELVDGLAGGMCQIASTLHAAAFFGGLDIVSSTPHSRPSAYIPMGLDSTVVYPSTDLKLRNPFPFPVVMHYKVNQGAVKVELLGKEKPYQVLLEREIRAETGHGSQSRRDPTAPPGQRLILQEGYPGYSLVRRRYIFPTGAVLPRAVVSGKTPVAEAIQALPKSAPKLVPLKKEQWGLSYPSTQLIVAIGSGPAKLKKKDPPPSHHIPPVPKDDNPIFKMLR